MKFLVRKPTCKTHSVYSLIFWSQKGRFELFFLKNILILVLKQSRTKRYNAT